MKIILLGFNSFTGSSISEYFGSKPGVVLTHVGRQESALHQVVKFEVPNDISMLEQSVRNLVKQLSLDDSIIINCISMGDVDKCEVEKNRCKIQNHLFVEALYRNIKKSKFKKLIHFSTNAVYDGNNAPYKEISDCFPVNFYGLTKLKADQFLLEQKDPRLMLIRPITMYGKVPEGGRPNPVSMIIERLKNNQPLTLVDDVLVNILYVGDLVRAINQLIEMDFKGLINISGDEVYSRYELGLKIAKLIGSKEDLISSATSTEFETIANRPMNTSFDNTLMKSMRIETHKLKQVISKLYEC